MKNRNMVLMVLAIGCGLVAAFLTAKFSLAGAPKQEMVPVLVAAKNIDQGTKLDDPDKFFVRKPFPKESVPPEFVDDVAQMKGKVLSRTIRAGAHVTNADLVSKTSIDLPVGPDGTPFKAMAIKVSQHTAVSGFIQPGDRVDVMVVEHKENGKTSSTLLLQKTLVVAINEINQKPEGQGGAIKGANTVTLAVKQQEGMVLALAQARGELTLMLRSKDDETVSKRRVADSFSDSNRDEQAAAPGGAGHAVEVATVRVPVARNELVAGTKITNPEELFEEKELPEAMVPEGVVRDMAELANQTVKKVVYKGMLVAKAAFEGELPKAAPAAAAAPAPAPAPVQTHTLVIQVGTSSPQYVKYDDKGRLIDPSQPLLPAGPAAPAASPEKTGDAAEIKPEMD